MLSFSLCKRLGYAIIAGSLFALTGCGGGGDTQNMVSTTGGGSNSGGGSSPSTAPAISAIVLSSNTRNVSVDTGTLDTNANTVNIGALSGTVNGARDQVFLSGGGTVDLTPGLDGNAARFVSTPLNGPNTTGIVGYPTQLSEMPNSGSASYFGDTQITAQVGSDIYELNGTARLNADFGAGRFSDLTLSNLSGQRFPALGAVEVVSDVATLTMSNISINGTALSGGASASSGGTIALSGSQSNTLSGQFFGPNAAEAGGVFVIDDIASSGTIVTGDFLTK